MLGAGGMGTVYRATQLSLNRVVALKLLAGELSDDRGFRRRFQREGQLQAGLDHQHIVTIYEAGQTDEGLFLAMRLVGGPTLKELIQTNQLDPRRTLRLLAQVAQALDSAHQAGLIHRDVKPQNILIGQDDHAYLADFGLTKAPDDTEGLTGTGQFVGTIDYSAPEQIQGQRATPASDCYSLAAVLFECLTGQVPFARSSESAALQAHLTESPPRVSERRPGMAVALDEVIARGMAKDPAARPQSSAELVRQATLAVASPPQALAGAADLASSQATRLGQPRGTGDRAQTTRVPSAGAAALTGPSERSVSPAAEVTRAAGPQTPAPAPPARSADETSPRATPARSGAGRRNPAAMALVLMLAAAAVAAGFLVGHSGSGGAPQPSNFASAGHLQLRYSSAWQLGAAVPTPPGMSFANPVKLADSHTHTALTAGEVADAGGPSPLSASFRAALQGSLPRPDPVALGALHADRYSGLRVRGLAGEMTVYAVPTSAGVATIACTVATAAASAGRTECGQVAATLRVVGARAYPLGPNPDYARVLSSTFAKLRAAVAHASGRLRAATTPSGQAQGARRLAAAYSTAGTAVSAAAVSPRDSDANAVLAASLRQLAAGYTLSARAAGSADTTGYRQARDQIAAGSASLRRALAGLSALGYAVKGS